MEQRAPRQTGGLERCPQRVCNWPLSMNTRLKRQRSSTSTIHLSLRRTLIHGSNNRLGYFEPTATGSNLRHSHALPSTFGPFGGSGTKPHCYGNLVDLISDRVVGSSSQRVCSSNSLASLVPHLLPVGIPFKGPERNPSDCYKLRLCGRSDDARSSDDVCSSGDFRSTPPLPNRSCFNEL